MKFKLDENLPSEASDLLEKQGCETVTVVDEQLSGSGDSIVAARIQSEQMCLVTLDLGFGDIRAYPPEDYPGIIVLRPHRQDKASIIAVIRVLLSCLHTGESLEHRLWIVEPKRVRIHEPE
ncbi:DUF5615 family PIN-like protein [Dehalococcoidia bacterium]|nr:DUF5615 family PIN-like protein [Dehalococcoidia bacterium]